MSRLQYPCKQLIFMHPSVKVLKFDDVLFFMIRTNDNSRTNCPIKFISMPFRCRKDYFDEIIIEIFNAQITFSNNLGIKTKDLGTSILSCKINFFNSRCAIATKYSYFF